MKSRNSPCPCGSGRKFKQLLTDNALKQMEEQKLLLGEAIDAFAAGLLALDLQRGDRVGIWSPNNVEWVKVEYPFFLFL